MGADVTKTLKAVFFDLDGTIVDTEPLATQILKEYYLEHGVSLSASDSQYTNGKKWAVALNYLFKKHPLRLPEDQITNEILNRYQKVLETELPVVHGSVEAVRDIAKEFNLALVSGSQRADILFALGSLQIEHHFKVILGAEDYVQSKPSPEGYQKALTMLKLKPSEVVVFEDSDVGIASAKSAGIKVVAITGTNHYGQKFLGADLKIHDFKGIDRAWLRSRF